MFYLFDLKFFLRKQNKTKKIKKKTEKMERKKFELEVTTSLYIIFWKYFR